MRLIRFSEKIKISILLSLIAILPSTRCFFIKTVLLRKCGFQVDASVRFVSTARIFVPNLVIGAGTWIGHFVRFVGGSTQITIGRNVDVGPGVLFSTGSHFIGTSDRRAASGYSNPILIGDGCWIGAQAVILGGVTVGSGSIIGAGSLVNLDIPANCIAYGVPAKVRRFLDGA